LRHGQAVRFADFTPDGYHLLTTCEDDRCRVWDVSPDARPTADLVALAELSSGHRIDGTGAVFPLKPEEHLQRAVSLWARYANELTTPAPTVRAWRRKEILDCMTEGNLEAAEFHYWWLVAEAALEKK
jgi:hypothetical protein